MMAEARQFFVFAYTQYYPCGGASDCIFVTFDVNEAEQKGIEALKNGEENAHIATVVGNALTVVAVRADYDDDWHAPYTFSDPPIYRKPTR